MANSAFDINQTVFHFDQQKFYLHLYCNNYYYR